MTKKTRTQSKSSPAALVGPDLEPSKYDAALNFLFDRPEPESEFNGEWYWNPDETHFDMTPVDWVRFQTRLFKRCGNDLSHYSDKQVGMGLRYLMDSGLGDVAASVLDPTVPKCEALAMMQRLPTLWSDCIGPRLRDVRAPIGTGAGGRLGYVCYMWFDVWPVPYLTSSDAEWTAAIWAALKAMLAIDVREVQIAALHGVGHCAAGRSFDAEVTAVMLDFARGLNGVDRELADYALAAARGMVQ